MLDRAGGEAFLGFGWLLVWGLRVWRSVVGEVALAFEAAGGEAGQGVEHAQKVEWVGFDCFAQRIGADVGDGVANEAGGDFVCGLEDVDALLLAGEIEGEFVAGAGLLEEAELAQVFLIATAAFPAADGIFGEVLAEFAKVLANSGVGDAVVEHFIYLVAQGLGQMGDGAAPTTGMEMGWWRAGVME